MYVDGIPVTHILCNSDTNYTTIKYTIIQLSEYCFATMTNTRKSIVNILV